MDDATARGWVKALAILQWAGSALGLFLGILLIFGGVAAPSLLPEFAQGNPELADLDAAEVAALGAVLAVMGAILIALSILGGFIGLGLWRHRNWARILTLISAWVSVVWLVLDLVMAAKDGAQFFLTLLFSLVFGALYAGIIWLLSRERAVVALFRSKGEAKAAPQAVSEKAKSPSSARKGKKAKPKKRA